MTSKQRISITFVPAGQQAMHERLENWGNEKCATIHTTAQSNLPGSLSASAPVGVSMRNRGNYQPENT